MFKEAGNSFQHFSNSYILYTSKDEYHNNGIIHVQMPNHW